MLLFANEMSIVTIERIWSLERELTASVSIQLDSKPIDANSKKSLRYGKFKIPLFSFIHIVSIKLDSKPIDAKCKKSLRSSKNEN